MTVKNFVDWVYPEASKDKDFDPRFAVAQGAIESAWGKSAIGNNIYGITKGSSWNGPVQLVTTTEFFSSPSIRFKSPETVLSVTRVKPNCYKYKVKRLFRVYGSVEECIRDHSAILKKPQFADAWPYRHDAKEYVKHLQDTIGLRYATDPNYVSTMYKVIDMIDKVLKK